MKFDDTTRFQIGALTVLVACVGGFAIYQAVTPTQAPPVQAPAAAVQDQPQAPAASDASSKPSLTLEGEGNVSQGTGGHEVRAVANENFYYAWTIQGGTIDGPADGSRITWSAGKTGAVTLTCKATRPSTGETTVATLRVNVQAGPSIGRFEAIPPVITAGSSCRLVWTVQDATQVTLDPGGQDFSSYTGSGLEQKPTETATYTLKASNKAGQTVSKDLTVKVVPAPRIGSLRAEAVAGTPDTFRIMADFSGGKAELKRGETVVGTSESSPMNLQVSDLKNGASLQFVVTNEAGAYITNTLTVTKP